MKIVRINIDLKEGAAAEGDLSRRHIHEEVKV
jgi:hypothetical protein